MQEPKSARMHESTRTQERVQECMRVQERVQEFIVTSSCNASIVLELFSSE